MKGAESNKRPSLEGLVKQPFRIRIYIDGYHAYLMTQALVDQQKIYRNNVAERLSSAGKILLNDLPESAWAPYALSSIKNMEGRVVGSAERHFTELGIDLIKKKDVDRIESKFFFDPFGHFDGFDATGRVAFDVTCDAVIFAPRFDRERLIADLEKYRSELADSRDIEVLNRDIRRLQSGRYEKSQRFYSELSKLVGEQSQNGYLKFDDGKRKSFLSEKGVDSDFTHRIWKDISRNSVDFFVLLTNDADHAQSFSVLAEHGKQFALMGYEDRPARALQDQLGSLKLYFNALSYEEDFDFSDYWLAESNPDSIQRLDEARQQWEWWKSEGLV
ncbi:NYN domain-containing protein [Novosphingobium sp. HII-3]|uniref:NYN domain-containing protein n=1 Tax=Novosphingobium sp. HII-3 TaxID=2075565 RepID=UPI000CDB12D4|nr:NYN domain-containing protein [Novosphingobium sp. HII-3]